MHRIAGFGHGVFLIAAATTSIMRVYSRNLYINFSDNDPRKGIEDIAAFAVAARMFIICVIDRFSPSLRILLRIFTKYGTELWTIFYGFICFLLIFTYFIRLCIANLSGSPGRLQLVMLTLDTKKICKCSFLRLTASQICSA